jgi:hypothetical protein
MYVCVCVDAGVCGVSSKQTRIHAPRPSRVLTTTTNHYAKLPPTCAAEPDADGPVLQRHARVLGCVGVGGDAQLYVVESSSSSSSSMV